MKNETTQNVYTRCKLEVLHNAPGVLSHILNCHCKTINHPTEKTFLLKKVNFYKFKAYVTETLRVNNWQDWYFAAIDTPVFNQTLADFINLSENRTQIWIQEIDLCAKLDSLIAQATQLTKETQNWLAAH